MGGGNAQKSAKARADALAKAQASKTPEERKAAAAKAKADSEAVKCAICKQGFMVTAKVVQLMAHIESKHPKEEPSKCFPAIDAMREREAAAATAAAAPAAKPKKKKAVKKEGLDDLLNAGLEGSGKKKGGGKK